MKKSREEIIEMIINNLGDKKVTSPAYLQRKYKIGYSLAVEIINIKNKTK